MIEVSIIGASGYTGAELAILLKRHPQVKLKHLFVSEQSPYAGLAFSAVYPKWRGCCDQILEPLNSDAFETLENVAQKINNNPGASETQVQREVGVIFLATDHAVSLVLAPQFLAMGYIVLDLSGAYRLKEATLYPDYYGFEHAVTDYLMQAVYGLPEWYGSAIREANLIAVPGCYPTSAILALKPLAAANALAPDAPIINSVSGVSGAGRKPTEITAFCEVSLKAYAVFNHRHQPEIDAYVGTKTLFQPHLGPYHRGILTTIYARLNFGCCADDVEALYRKAYEQAPCVRLVSCMPSVAQVQYTPFCDIAFCVKEQQLIIFSALDNLLKGAATQAIQCFNKRMGWPETEALL